MAVALLVAGRGTRFTEGMPKCIMDVGGKTLLERTIQLIRECSTDIPILVITGHMGSDIANTIETIDYENIKVIHNPDFFKDQNILSAYRAMNEVKKNILILEGDCVFNKSTIEEMISCLSKDENILFTKNKANPSKQNAIINSSKGKFIQYHKGARDKSFIDSDWRDMAGAVIFNHEGIEYTKNWIEDNTSDPSETYYFEPLLAIDKEKISVHYLSEKTIFSTFNTEFEYLKVMLDLEIKTNPTLVEVESLSHVEEFSHKRVTWLKDKIESEGVWTKPICIDGEYGIVMDGQHRMEVAKSLGMKYIPAVLFDHKEVSFWSLRDNHEVDLKQIMHNYTTKNAYPYKTVKYAFPVELPSCSINLEELKLAI